MFTLIIRTTLTDLTNHDDAVLDEKFYGPFSSMEAAHETMKVFSMKSFQKKQILKLKLLKWLRGDIDSGGV